VVPGFCTSDADPELFFPIGNAGPAQEPSVRVQRVAFWLLAYVFFAVMLGPALPSPLYVLDQAEWHFSADILTPGCSTCAWTYRGGARVHGNGRRAPLARNGRAIAQDISR
jgi:hypothetical protein